MVSWNMRSKLEDKEIVLSLGWFSVCVMSVAVVLVGGGDGELVGGEGGGREDVGGGGDERPF